MKITARSRVVALCVACATLLATAQQAAAHGVQVAYGTTPTGFVRIYIEHWHGPLSPNQLGPRDNISVTVTSSTGSSTFDVNVSGTVNNTTVGALPGLTGPAKVLSAPPGANNYRNWGYWDFAPGACNEPISIRINGGNSIIFDEANSSLYPQTISAQTFTDQGAPVITANNVTVTGDCSGAVVNYKVGVSDDCDKNPTVSYSHPSGSFFPVGTTVVTVTATDNTGKTSVKAFNVNVVVGDSTPPTLTVPGAITANAVAGKCGANVSFDVTATDNCSTPTVTLSHASGSVFPVGTTTVTATARDANGNQTVRTFTVTVADTERPTIACAGDITVNAAAGACEAKVGFNATASDNCSGVSVSYSHAPGSIFPVGQTVVTATAKDAAGNTASCSFTVTVLDVTSPIIATAAAGQTVECGSDNAAALKAWLASNGGAVAKDSCSAVTWTNNFAGLTAACGNTGSATVTFTATDKAGNASSTTATFAIVDTVAPVITAAAVSQTIECDGSSATALSKWLASNGGASATDACGSVSWSHNFAGLAGGCGDTGSATVTFTAVDQCGNASTTTATFTVKDTTAPVVASASSVTVESDGAGNLAALNAWLASNGGATAKDNCSAVTWSNNFSSVSDECGTTGSAKVTFTATDACGNSTTTTATFTIVDTTAPSINTAAANSVVESDGAGNTAALAAWLASNGGASASDIGSSVTWSNNFTALSDDCGSTGTTKVTFTATDACGNASTTVATFTIVDTTKPVLASNVRDISPNERPVTFTVTSSDVGGGSTPSITNVTAHRVNGSGKTLDKTPPYKHSVSGNKVTIETSGGVDTVWTIYASSVDECGNVATSQFVVNVVNPTVTKGK